jgi:hypothetical protein
VNSVAVKAGFILAYDKANPGWRITPQGRAYIAGIPSEPEVDARVITEALAHYEAALRDVHTLVDIYSREWQRSGEKTRQELQVFKRSGVILTVTAWETYVEDTLALRFRERLDRSDTPDDVGRAFNAVAQTWLTSGPKPCDVAAWAGEGWKAVILDRFEEQLARLNTPNSEEVGKLFKRYLELDVREIWKWQGTSSNKACKKLDSLIRRRGQLVHRGGEKNTDGTVVRLDRLRADIRLIERLVWCTETALGVAWVTL